MEAHGDVQSEGRQARFRDTIAARNRTFKIFKHFARWTLVVQNVFNRVLFSTAIYS